MVVALVVAFVVLLLLGLPISYVLAGAGLLAVLVHGKLNLTIVAGKMFEALAQAKVNIEMISTSEIKISVILRLDKGESALRALHAAFLE